MPIVLASSLGRSINIISAHTCLAGDRALEQWRPSPLLAFVRPEKLVQISEFQQLMDAIYGDRDRERGLSATVAWLAEEVGELAQAVRKGDPARREHELGDVLAWLASLANQLGLSLEEAARRYASGCPCCAAIPCRCA
jgi:NTP pyrophosphatase (non-canonical NTP hydrolase)